MVIALVLEEANGVTELGDLAGSARGRSPDLGDLADQKTTGVSPIPTDSIYCTDRIENG